MIGLETGDIILETNLKNSFSKLIRYFTKSKYSHATLYIGDFKIVEATIGGVIESSIQKYLTKDFKVAVIRPKYINEESNFIVWVLKGMVGRPYDYSSLFGYLIAWVFAKFNLYIRNPLGSSYSYQCSEMVDRALQIVNERFDLRKTLKVKDYKLISPQIFLVACNLKPDCYKLIGEGEII